MLISPTEIEFWIVWVFFPPWVQTSNINKSTVLGSSLSVFVCTFAGDDLYLEEWELAQCSHNPWEVLLELLSWGEGAAKTSGSYRCLSVLLVLSQHDANQPLQADRTFTTLLN